MTPKLFHDQRLWSHANDRYLCIKGGHFATYNGLNEQKTPEQLGCKVGEVLRSYSIDPDGWESFKIKHLVGSETTIKLTAFQSPDEFEGEFTLGHRRVLSGSLPRLESPPYQYGFHDAPTRIVMDSSFGDDTLPAGIEEPQIIVTRDIKAMGLAAGGKLSSSILPLHSPCSIR